VKNLAFKLGSKNFRSCCTALAALVLITFAFRRFLFTQDLNWDLLNYHYYVPSALLSGNYLSDFHPSGIQNFLFPLQDLIHYPFMTLIPGYLATLLLGIMHFSIVIPLWRISKSLSVEISSNLRIFQIVVATTGSMYISEFSTTMGDLFPTILVIWCVSLLIDSTRAFVFRHEVIVGTLLGFALLFKLTMLWAIPLIIILLFGLQISWIRRIRPLLIAFGIFLSVYFVWGFNLNRLYGNPIYPFWNEIFQSDFFPAENWREVGFGITNFFDVLRSPLWGVRSAQTIFPNLPSGLFPTNASAEAPFLDMRILLSFFALLLFIVSRRISKSLSVLQFRFLIAYLAGYFTWVLMFGVQRYALLLECLAIFPIYILVSRFGKFREPIFIGACILIVLSTWSMDFGRAPLSREPLVPKFSVSEFSEYDYIVLAGSPMAFMSRARQTHGNPLFFGMPFNDSDKNIAESKLEQSSKGAILFWDDSSAGSIANDKFGLTLADLRCRNIPTPLNQIDLNDRTKNHLPSRLLLCDLM
jgi:hypothetical protein